MKRGRINKSKLLIFNRGAELEFLMKMILIIAVVVLASIVMYKIVGGFA